ncbi:MAG: DUF1801 domain-containing protein [Pseudomonadota bacterium]
MQYDVADTKAYLAALEEDWRRDKLLLLRDLISRKAPDLEEVISYKMLGYRDGEELVFHLNAQKNHVGFYVGNAEKIDPEGDLLEGLNVGKGCIRYSKSVAIDEARMGKFIARAVQMHRDGEDIGC